MNTIKTDTIIRTVVLILALINSCLTMAGMSPLPIEDEQIESLLSMLFMIGAALWSWWKNNSFTPAAIKADEYMHTLKSNNLE